MEEQEEGRDGLTKHTRAEWHRGQGESKEQERGTVCAGHTDSHPGSIAEMEKQQVGPVHEKKKEADWPLGTTGGKVN